MTLKSLRSAGRIVQTQINTNDAVIEKVATSLALRFQNDSRGSNIDELLKTASLWSRLGSLIGRSSAPKAVANVIPTKPGSTAVWDTARGVANKVDAKPAAVAKVVDDVATKAGPSVSGHLAKVVGRIPGIITGSARDAGKRVTEALAMDPNSPGRFARAVGGAVKYSPHAAVLGGAAYTAHKPAIDYMRAKGRQFETRQVATRPYYDASVGRFS
jgi:hypothetical protein